MPLNVIYLNALPGDEHKQFFVAALAAEIYRWMVTAAPAGGGPSLLFYLDEARDYLPAGTRTSTSSPTCTPCSFSVTTSRARPDTAVQSLPCFKPRTRRTLVVNSPELGLQAVRVVSEQS